MRPSRPIYLTIAALATLTLLFSGWRLAQRIEAWNETKGRTIFYFFPVETTGFTFAGQPVTISDDLNDAGEGEVLIEYGGDTLRIPVTVPNDLAIPLLARHAKLAEAPRLRVRREGPVVRGFRGRPERREDHHAPRRGRPHTVRCRGKGRPVRPRDRGGLGLGRGPPRSLGLHVPRVPTRGRVEHRDPPLPRERQGVLPPPGQGGARGPPPPTRRDDELEEGTWQFDAAIPLMGGRTPSITSEQQALRSAGWTLPVASLCIVVMMFSLGFAFAPRRRWAGDEKAH